MFVSIVLPLCLQHTMKIEDQFYFTFGNPQILALQEIKIVNIHI